MDNYFRQSSTYAAIIRKEHIRKAKQKASCKHEKVVIICLRCKSHLEKSEAEKSTPLLSIEIPQND